jgi:hypothetical protein
MSRFSSLASAFVVLRRDKTARQLPPSSSYSSSSLVPYKILIHENEHEDEDEKNQIKSHASALRLFFFSAFRIPTSEFLTPYTMELV